MELLRRLILSVVFVGLFASTALACSTPPPPPTYQERLADQRSWREDAYAIALVEVVLVRNRSGVFEAVVALKGSPPVFQGFSDPGNADCGASYPPEMGARAIVYFFADGQIAILRLTAVVDPALPQLLQAAANRARQGENYLSAPAGSYRPSPSRPTR